MAQLPFTPAGVAQKQTELYALTDANLLVQARAITSDIQSWLLANFILSSQQQAWLSGAPPEVRFAWGAIIGAAVMARRPIAMAEPPVYGKGRRTKQIIIDITGNLTYYPPVSGTGPLSGTLQVNITWQLVD